MSPKKAFKPNTKTKRKHHKKIWKPKTACPTLFCLFSHDNDMILLSQDHFLMIKEQVPSDKKYFQPAPHMHHFVTIDGLIPSSGH